MERLKNQEKGITLDLHRENTLKHFKNRFKARLHREISDSWVESTAFLIRNYKNNTHQCIKISHSDEWFLIDYRGHRLFVLYSIELDCLVTCLHYSDYPNVGDTIHNKKLFTDYLLERSKWIKTVKSKKLKYIVKMRRQ